MDRKMVDSTEQYERMRAQLLLIRVTLGLSPADDPVAAVNVLFNEGRDAFEKLRGQGCDYAAQWTPR